MKKNRSMTLVGVLVVVAAIAIAFYAADAIRHNARLRLANAVVQSQDMLIKSEVQTAVSMLQQISSKQKKGEYTLAQAKKLGADVLREMRYGTDAAGYFWADTSAGVNVVLYGNKTVEGKSRINDIVNGVAYVKEIIKNGKLDGGGYTDYFYPKQGDTTPLTKRGYSLYFAPFDWVVGTGYYVQDLNSIIAEKLKGF